VATLLSRFFESLLLEKRHQVPGRDLRHPRHQGSPTHNSST
jgi:hypothetical protein